MTWPNAVFGAAVLHGLDDRGREELERAGTLHELERGAVIYRSAERGQALYVVADGEVALRGMRRGRDADDVELRRAGAGDSFGEEASIGASWRETAVVASERARVAELPVALVRRALARAGGGEVAERVARRLRRRGTAGLLRTVALGARLDEGDFNLLLDGVRHRALERGQIVYRTGEPASDLWLVVDGMVQLQTEDDERLRVKAYLVRGDFFGDEELARGVPRSTTAVTSGASLLLSIPAALARTLADRNPGLLPRLRRVGEAHAAEQRAVVGAAAANATQHAFRDLYRLQVARSLLVIDLDTCVRCGHCAWSCESLHGVARLVRRGDKMVTRLAGEGATAERAAPLLLPNSCQHCDNPACMPDCPTGAIGRDPRGEIFIRDELCTGCGACAKGCPWDNIQIVPRPPDAPRPALTWAGEGGAAPFSELAVKCDLCRGRDGPACVKSCPTGAIFRVRPSEALPEVAELLGLEDAGAPARPVALPARARRDGGIALVAAAALALAAVGIARRGAGAWAPGRGVGYALGVAAAVLFVLLAAYGPGKRLVRLWSRRLPPGGEAPARVRSMVQPQLDSHVAIGLAAMGCAVAHAGVGGSASSGSGLAVAFLGASALGLLAALAYRVLPRRLSRLERSASLPEDLGALRRELADRLYAAVSGRSDVVKTIFARVLAPYERAPLGWLSLILSGRDLGGEQRALRARIDRMLEGRASSRLGGLDELVRLCVEKRALRAQWVLSSLLRVWLPLHLVAAAVAAVLLVAHVAEVAFR